MSFKLKKKEGMISFVMKVGENTYVQNEMPYENAKKLLDGTHTVKKSHDIKNYNVIVDDTYYLECEEIKKKKI